VLLVADAVFWLLHITSEALVDRVSRRLANLSYVIWMMAYNIQSLASFLAVEIISVVHAELEEPSSAAQPAAAIADKATKFNGANDTAVARKNAPFDLLEAINRNGLLYFLLANVLTGVVNLTTSTMHASVSTALAELTAYMFVLSVTVAVLHVYDISVKFW
jgi:phosphatidylinositol glycan class W